MSRSELSTRELRLVFEFSVSLYRAQLARFLEFLSAFEKEVVLESEMEGRIVLGFAELFRGCAKGIFVYLDGIAFDGAEWLEQNSGGAEILGQLTELHSDVDALIGTGLENFFRAGGLDTPSISPVVISSIGDDEVLVNGALASMNEAVIELRSAIIDARFLEILDQWIAEFRQGPE